MTSTPLRAFLAVGLMLVVGLATAGGPAWGQTPEPVQDPPTIRIDSDAGSDAAIAARLSRIFAQLDTLSAVQVRVAEGVVTLDGVVAHRGDLDRAEAIAARIEGVVAVRNKIEASVQLGERVSPFLQQLMALWQAALDTGPLLLLSLLIVAGCVALGWWAASFNRFWRGLTPNPFVGDLLAQLVRAISLIVGIVLALNLLGATALMGTVLGGAGVLGIAVGFALRDTLENYISSIMLSLRQPFRANDHVVIDGQEGKVVRLTSRATVLMTLDGNHLRIPNMMVFRAVILNYTRNPQRRMEFELGVDAEDDPEAAIKVGVAALAALDFILADPAPSGVIVTVGDSNIVLKFTGWIDQSSADFLKARSAAIRVAKMAVEAAGFSLPEPIYRLRIDQVQDQLRTAAPAPPGAAAAHSARRRAGPSADRPVEPAPSVHPDDHIDRTIEAERRASDEENLLSPKRPIE